MNSTEKFDAAYEALEKRLSAMSAGDFFSMCGVSIEDLPYKYQYSKEIDMSTAFSASTSFSGLDLKCA